MEVNDQTCFRRGIVICSALAFLFVQAISVQSQSTSGRTAIRNDAQSTQSTEGNSDSTQPESELRTGTVLTSKGLYREAIPHLLLAQGRVSNEYAASFNLALCYVGTSEYGKAIEILKTMNAPSGNADVNNLLAQAYIGNGQGEEGFAAFQRAVAIAPESEKLYSLVSDACMEHKNYALGLRVIDAGLQHLPRSARLHYQKALLLTETDEFDQAKPDFELAAKLAPESEIAYLASAQESLFEGNIDGAIQAARAGFTKGYRHPALLTVFGEALIRSGVSPGQPEFAEAQAALEAAVEQRPNDPASLIALSTLDLQAGQLDEAISHLEKARQLTPDNPAIYANLVKAYQRRGQTVQAQDALAILQKLNQEQAARINAAPGDRKLGYASHEADPCLAAPRQ